MDRQRRWLLLPEPIRTLPADLAAVLALVALTNLAVFLPVVNDSPIRIVAGLVFVLFVPGYAFIAALFPEAGEAPTTEAPDVDAAAEAGGAAATGLQDRGIDGIERTALSFGLSIAIVPLIGLALNFTPFGIRLVPILVSISAFTVGATVVAALRRWELPDSERFRVPYRRWIAAGRSELTDPDSTVDAALNVALVLAILLATTSVVYAVAVPQQGEQFSEFYVLTEGEDGELVAAGYPAELQANEPTSIHVGVENNEYGTVEYTVVIQLQAVEIAGNQTTLTDREQLSAFPVSLPHNESAIQERTLELDSRTADEFAGPDRRVKFLLYRGTPPATPTADTAYQDLHLWVEVTTDSDA
jgi:uncharacterized membrane protein